MKTSIHSHTSPTRSLAPRLGAVALGCLLLSACGGSSTPAEEPRPQPKPVAPVEKADERYSKLPEPSAAPEFLAPEAKREKLENGLSLWEMKHGNAPLVSIHLLIPAGTAQDPQGKAGLTMLAADLLDEGAGQLNALELSDRLGQLATNYSSSAGLDYVLLSMDALAENLDASLSILADIVQRPQLSQTEFQRRKDHYLAQALASRDDPGSARNKALSHALFGKGYGGDSPSGTADTLKSISYFNAKTRVKELTVPDGAHLVVAGQFDSDEFKELSQKYFGKWKGKRKSFEPKLEDEPGGKTAFVVDFPDAAQSSLVIARRAGADGDPNYFPEEVMNDPLGGSFTGRINMNLREDKGYTYGASSLFRRFQYAGYYGIYSDVISEATVASVQEVFSELKAVCGERPLTDSERNQAVEGMLLGFPMDFTEVSSIGMRLVALPLHDRPADYYQTWPEQVAAVTTARANEAVQPYCNPDQYSVIIAGDLAKMEPGLKKMGLAIQELDRDGLPVETKSDE